MAWSFVRLKTKLLLNGLRGQGWRVVLVVVGAVAGVWFAGAGFVVLARSGADTANGSTVAALVGTALALGWTALPLLGFGSDASLDPMRLSLLPLSRAQMMTGLLAASFVGVGAAITAIALLGAVVGSAPAGPGAVLVVVAALGQLLVCICGSRAVLAWLSSALRTRRGRDLRVIVVALIALLPQALRILAARQSANNLAQYHGIGNVLGWLPTALAMRAMVAAGRGHLLTSAVELVVCAMVIAGLIWWWATSLDRMMTTVEAQATRRSGRAAKSGDPLFGTVFAWLPRSRVGAVAARELRSTWRDPRRRVQLVTSILLPFFVVAGFLTGGVAHRSGLVYAALVIVGLSGGGRGYNQIGFDGRSWWLHEACGADFASDLRGKNIALVLTTVPIAVLAAVVLAVLTDGWGELAPVVLMAFGLEGIQLAIGNVLSVRSPWPVPESGTNLWATSSGQGCLVGILGMVGLVVQGLIAVPFIVAAVLIHAPLARAVIGMAAVPYGYAVWVLGSRRAVRSGDARGPEILAAVSAGSSR